MNREIILVICIVIFIVLGLLLLYKYKKEYLKDLCYYAVIQAEEIYKSKEGQQKLEYAILTVKGKLPCWVRWMISTKLIKNVIEKVLFNLQIIFKASKNKQIAILDNIRNNGFNENNLNRLQYEVETNGYIEGYLEKKIDLKGSSDVVGGIRAGVKF